MICALPYRDINGAKALLIDYIPDCLLPQKKIQCQGCDTLPILWRENDVEQDEKHVGSHILHFLCDVEDPKKCELQSIGENPYGFCGQDGCFTQLKAKKKHGGLSIVSNCPYHYAGMNYKAAAQFSKSSPCTNIPVHCSLCPFAISGDPQTWKYNAVYCTILINSSPICDCDKPDEKKNHFVRQDPIITKITIFG